MLTVGVPIYNAENFLERCLERLCAETIDYRILISDNASTDKTEEISRSFAAKDSRIQYVRQDSCIDVIANHQYVLDHAGTKYFSWRAHDDLNTPNYFKQLLDLISRDDSIHVAVGGTRYEDPDGNPPADNTLPSELPADVNARREMLFRCYSKSWFYGVFQSDLLSHRLKYVRDNYGYTWGLDPLLLLPYVMEASVATSSEAYFIQHLSGLSATRYRPAGVVTPSHMVSRYCRVGFHFADEIAGSFAMKLLLYRYVVRSANGGAEKFRRIVKRAIFWPYYRATGRL